MIICVLTHRNHHKVQSFCNYFYAILSDCCKLFQTRIKPSPSVHNGNEPALINRMAWCRTGHISPKMNWIELNYSTVNLQGPCSVIAQQNVAMAVDIIMFIFVRFHGASYQPPHHRRHPRRPYDRSGNIAIYNTTAASLYNPPNGVRLSQHSKLFAHRYRNCALEYINTQAVFFSLVFVNIWGWGKFLWCIYLCPSGLIHWLWVHNIFNLVPRKQTLNIWMEILVPIQTKQVEIQTLGIFIGLHSILDYLRRKLWQMQVFMYMIIISWPINNI